MIRSPVRGMKRYLIVVGTCLATLAILFPPWVATYYGGHAHPLWREPLGVHGLWTPPRPENPERAILSVDYGRLGLHLAAMTLGTVSLLAVFSKKPRPPVASAVPSPETLAAPTTPEASTAPTRVATLERTHSRKWFLLTTFAACWVTGFMLSDEAQRIAGGLGRGLVPFTFGACALIGVKRPRIGRLFVAATIMVVCFAVGYWYGLSQAPEVNDSSVPDLLGPYLPKEGSQ